MIDKPVTPAALESAGAAIRKERRRLADMVSTATGIVIDAKDDPAASAHYPELVAAALIALSNERVCKRLDRIAAALESRDDYDDED